MPTRQLLIIRIALVVGVATFAGIVAFQRSRMAMPSGDVLPSLAVMRYALWALAALSVGAAFFLRTRIEGASPQLRGAFLIVGWAFGEGVALFGTVLHFLGGEINSMALGLLAFAASLILLPIPRAR